MESVIHYSVDVPKFLKKLYLCQENKVKNTTFVKSQSQQNKLLGVYMCMATLCF